VKQLVHGREQEMKCHETDLTDMIRPAKQSFRATGEVMPKNGARAQHDQSADAQ
jgi:hypothetical protein